MRTRLFALSLLAGALAPGVYSHCDTLDGPVVADTKVALERGSVTPVLKWIPKQDEAVVRAAFDRTLKVRALGAEAQRLADFWFFETVVRIHRASEGAPYTGLKSAGTVDPAFAAADEALVEGSVDALVGEITRHVAEGLRTRFEHARAARLRADESVEAGRAYVAAYVAYVHYVEALHAVGAEGHHHD